VRTVSAEVVVVVPAFVPAVKRRASSSAAFALGYSTRSDAAEASIRRARTASASFSEPSASAMTCSSTFQPWAKSPEKTRTPPRVV
jgi:hypothetical protein